MSTWLQVLENDLMRDIICYMASEIIVLLFPHSNIEYQTEKKEKFVALKLISHKQFCCKWFVYYIELMKITTDKDLLFGVCLKN